MLSYRHGYHAGNFADVLKHAVITEVLSYLKQKDKPLLVLDTHAGGGFYDLQHSYAQKTGEASTGIRPLWSEPGPPAALATYLELVRRANPDGKLRWYPGSPWFCQQLLDGGDRLVLSELHPAEIEALKKRFGKEKRVWVVPEDGWKTLIAHLPPIEKRGLLLMDPSYEIKDDYDVVVKTLKEAVRRFATGTYAIWYPMINRRATDRLMSRLIGSAIPRMLRIEWCIAPDAPGHGMTGSGMIVVNPPFTLASHFAEALPWLADRLSPDGSWRVEELTGEAPAGGARR